MRRPRSSFIPFYDCVKSRTGRQSYPEVVRVVLDTNVLLSACLKPDGLEAQLVSMAIVTIVTACVTKQVWLEYEDVLFRTKFAACRLQAQTMLQQLKNNAAEVIAVTPVSAASDEDDNRFLECAVAANAKYLIT